MLLVRIPGSGSLGLGSLGSLRETTKFTGRKGVVHAEATGPSCSLPGQPLEQNLWLSLPLSGKPGRARISLLPTREIAPLALPLFKCRATLRL